MRGTLQRQSGLVLNHYLNELHTLGSELSFVGCDDIPISELYDPPIAVVRRDTTAIGRSAAELMLALLGGADDVAHVTLPSEFVARASCGPVAPAGKG
jgi:LacI family transcriptional regulator